MIGQWIDPKSGDSFFVIMQVPMNTDEAHLRLRYYHKNYDGSTSCYEYEEGHGMYEYQPGELLRAPAAKVPGEMFKGFRKAIANLQKCNCSCHS